MSRRKVFSTLLECSQMSRELYHSTTRLRLLRLLDNRDNVAKTRFFYVLYSDKTWVFDQSERAQGAIYILFLKYKQKLPFDAKICSDISPRHYLLREPSKQAWAFRGAESVQRKISGHISKVKWMLLCILTFEYFLQDAGSLENCGISLEYFSPNFSYGIFSLVIRDFVQL